MAVIEQAVLQVRDHRDAFSAKLLAKTPGVLPMDIGELIGWGTCFEADFSQWGEADADSLLIGESTHLYFHPLPSGAYSLAQLSNVVSNVGNQDTDDATPLPKKNISYSYRVHCLVISAKSFLEFHNNVVELYRTLVKHSNFRFLSGGTTDWERIPLSPIEISPQNARLVDTELLEALHDYPGSETVAALLMASFDSVCTLLASAPPTLQLLNGLIQCLPVAWRPELSFSTSLHFSQMRPLRLMIVEERNQPVRSICYQYAVPILNLLHSNQNSRLHRILERRGWQTYIYNIFEQKKFDELEKQLALLSEKYFTNSEQNLPGWHDLNRIGVSLLERMEINPASKNGMSVSPAETGNMPDNGLSADISSNGPVNSGTGNLLRGDFAHSVFIRADQASPNGPSQPETTGKYACDSLLEKVLEHAAAIGSTDKKNDLFGQTQQRLSQQFPGYGNEIRQMDSLIARSLFGDQLAVEMLDSAWRELYRQLSAEERGMIRETYIKLVQAIITQPRDPAYPKHPRRSVDALEVLNIFLAE
ncbi:MAG: hypothetical protein FWC50_03490 [Planctomycetaceae bacterium]|nr:hypothetical protein [Planctomycetaceae bacterium]